MLKDKVFMWFTFNTSKHKVDAGLQQGRRAQYLWYFAFPADIQTSEQKHTCIQELILLTSVEKKTACCRNICTTTQGLESCCFLARLTKCLTLPLAAAAP